MTDLDKRIEWLETHRALIKADLDAAVLAGMEWKKKAMDRAHEIASLKKGLQSEVQARLRAHAEVQALLKKLAEKG